MIFAVITKKSTKFQQLCFSPSKVGGTEGGSAFVESSIRPSSKAAFGRDEIPLEYVFDVNAFSP